MWKATLKGLLAHKLRMAMTAIAIVLGVSFVSGTFVLTDTITRVFDDLFSEATSGIDVFVRGEAAFSNVGNGQADQRPPIDESLLDTVASVQGVEVAGGYVEGYALIIDEAGEPILPVGPPTLGSTWAEDVINPFDLRQGRGPQAADEVVIDAGTSAAHDLAVGDRVEIVFREGKDTFEIVGIAGFGAADNLAGATVALFDLDTAQDVLGEPGALTSIGVAAADGVSADELRERIAAAVGQGIDVVVSETVADETAAAVDQGLGFVRTALLVFGSVALFVGAFIIANTFSIVVAQRTREFAILRALGATGGQVVRSVVLEATIVGLLGSVLGVAAGVGLAVGLKSLLATFGMDLPGGGLVVAPRTVVVGLLVGTGVTVVASLLPARRAARVEPIAAMRAAAAPAGDSSRTRTVAGAVLLTTGLSLLGWALGGDTPNDAAVVGISALLSFVAVGLLAPFAVRPLAAVIGAPAARMGVPGTLARGNAVRSPRRTAATASALMIGLALVAFNAVVAASLKESVATSLDEQLRADAILTAANVNAGGGFSPALAEELRSEPGIEVVSAVRFGQAKVNGGLTFVGTLDPATWGRVAATEVVEGDLAALARPDTIAIGSDAAEENGVGVGDTVPVVYAATGERTAEVVAVYEPDPFLNGGWVIGNDTYAANFTDVLDATLLVSGSVGAAEEVAAAYPNVQVRDQAEYREYVSGQIDQLLALVSALLGMAIVIAVLGITNTLALSVLERTREIGLLRAVGMTRRQTRSMVRWESIIVAVIGAVLGLVVGLGFGWAIVTALESQGITEFAVPGGQLVSFVIAAALAGVLAGIGPARRAARLDVLRAIATE